MNGGDFHPMEAPSNAGGNKLGILSDSHGAQVAGHFALAANSVRSFGRRRSRAPGQSSAEFALALPLFFLLIFSVMDFGRMFFVQENVQRAVAASARYASTGNHQAGTDPATSKGYTRVASIQNFIQQQAAISINMGASLSTVQISSVSGGAGSAGGPQDIVTVSVTTNLPLMTPVFSHFFPNGRYTFIASATVRNEPFPPSQTK